jgi:hypothetical protein
MKITTLLFSLLAAQAAMAADVYMSRDANGNVVFSDKPSANAEKHNVRELPSVPAFVPPPQVQQPARASEPAFNYTSLTIVTPQSGHTLATGYAGNVEVSGILSPGLRESDTLILMDNGVAVREGRQTAFQLTNLDRGEHQLQMVVKDKDGITLISSNLVKLFVQRSSVLKRGN